MVSTTKSSSWSPRNILIAAILLAAVIGAATGYSTSLLTHTSPSPQTRTFYLFARELFDNATRASGITSSYTYTSDRIIVNRGDTVTIRFYNPTDDNHTFTMSNPYATDLVVLGATKTAILNKDFNFVADSVGLFTYQCRFHTPQMAGTLVVQG